MTATLSRAPQAAPPTTGSAVEVPLRRYAQLLPLLLGGYLFFGRSFAYLSVPGLPLYVGEIVLGIGLYEGLRDVNLVAAVMRRSAPLRALAVLLVLGGMRLLLDLPTYGLDAARDSALVYYGLNALLVAAVLRVDPRPIRRWLDLYDRALPYYIIWNPISIAIELNFGSSLPTVPGSVSPIIDVKYTDAAAFLGLAAAFLLLRPSFSSRWLQRSRQTWIVLSMIGLLIAGTQSRGGLLSAVIMLAFTLIAVHRPWRLALRVGSVLAVLLAVAWLADAKVQTGYRELSVAQLADNLVSVVDQEAFTQDGESGEGLAGNVSWRTDYWTSIIEDNAFGDAAFTGQGFGISLARHYDLAIREGEQELRSAHSSHLSMLARLGLPGFGLWLAFLLILGRTVWRGAGRHAGRDGRRQPWLLWWSVGGLAGLLFNAIFDPNLEGPQVAFWTWTLVGIASQAAILPDLAGLDADPEVS
jgi:O-antigen ligase